jgi:hypothetical protein
MQHTNGLTVLMAGFAALLMSGSAQADVFTVGNNTVNTGVDASGSPLPDGTIGDPHYSLISVPGGTTDIRVRTSAGGYPIVPSVYIGDDSISAWIGPNNDNQLDGPIGNYDYRATFNLTGLNPATASLIGHFASDNKEISVLLNGVSESFTQSSACITLGVCYESFTPLSITSGFVAGVNTLDFIVNNAGGPTALRVELTGTASPVPEPASLLLLASLVTLTATSLRRRVRG